VVRDEALMTAGPPKQDLRQEGPSAVSAFQIDRKKCLTWSFRRIVAFVRRKLLQKPTNSEGFFFSFFPDISSPASVKTYHITVVPVSYNLQSHLLPTQPRTEIDFGEGMVAILVWTTADP